MLKKVIHLFISLLITTLVFANMELRNQFQQAVYSQKMAENLKKNLEQKRTLTPIELGYLGATKMILAKHYFNPFNKLQIFNQGRQDLENAIKLDSKNVELIYLRYSCAKNSPSFLHYHQNLEADRLMLESAVNSLNDSDLKNRIQGFMKN